MDSFRGERRLPLIDLTALGGFQALDLLCHCSSFCGLALRCSLSLRFSAVILFAHDAFQHTRVRHYVGAAGLLHRPTC